MEQIIKNFIESQIPELKGRLYPMFTCDLTQTTVAYTITPVSGGHLKQSQIELKIIGDYDECKICEEKLKKVLDMEEDSPFIYFGGLAFHSIVSGGGCLFNDAVQKTENTLYFIIEWRKNNAE